MTMKPYRLASLHHLHVELRLDHRRRRVVREVDDQQLGPREPDAGRCSRCSDRSFSLSATSSRIALAGRHGDGVQMGRIVRGGHDGRVARPHQGQAHVAESLLRSQARDQFPLRIEPHAILLEVLGGHLAAQAQNALRLGIAVVLRVPGGLGQLLDHQVLRRIASDCPCPGRSRRRRRGASRTST